MTSEVVKSENDNDDDNKDENNKKITIEKKYIITIYTNTKI